MATNENLVSQMPSDYGEISEWLKTNRNTFLHQPKLLTQVLEKLNSLLKNTESIMDFKKDMAVFIQTIKLEYDALLKEYNANLTLEKLVNFVNQNKCNEFFLNCKANEKSITFIDFVSITVEDRVRNRGERAQEEEEKEQVLAAKYEKAETETESNKELEELKLFLKRNQKIEYYKYIFDADSFSKTVFNAFNISLGIKMKFFGLEKIDSVLFIVLYNKINENKNNFSHGVFSISRKKWEDMKKVNK